MVLKEQALTAFTFARQKSQTFPHFRSRKMFPSFRILSSGQTSVAFIYKVSQKLFVLFQENPWNVIPSNQIALILSKAVGLILALYSFKWLLSKSEGSTDCKGAGGPGLYIPRSPEFRTVPTQDSPGASVWEAQVFLAWFFSCSVQLECGQLSLLLIGEECDLSKLRSTCLWNSYCILQVLEQWIYQLQGEGGRSWGSLIMKQDLISFDFSLSSWETVDN